MSCNISLELQTLLRIPYVFFSLPIMPSGLEQPHRAVSMPQDSYSSYHGISGLYINTGTVFE